jgi:hypothetical protein
LKQLACHTEATNSRADDRNAFHARDPLVVDAIDHQNLSSLEISAPSHSPPVHANTCAERGSGVPQAEQLDRCCRIENPAQVRGDALVIGVVHPLKWKLSSLRRIGQSPLAEK